MPDPSRLRPATPWARDQLAKMPADVRAKLEDAIPNGLHVGLSGKPPHVAAYLLRGDHEPVRLAAVYHQPSQWAAVWAVLHEYRETEHA